MLSPCALESELKQRKSFQKFHTNPKELSYSKPGRLSKYCNTTYQQIYHQGVFLTFDVLYKHMMFQSKNGREVKTLVTGYNPGLKGGWGKGRSQGYERPGRRDRRKWRWWGLKCWIWDRVFLWVPFNLILIQYFTRCGPSKWGNFCISLYNLWMVFT